MTKERIGADQLIEVVRRYLAAGYVYPVVHTAVDHGDHLELMYILRHLHEAEPGERMLKIPLSYDDPQVPSLTPWVPGLVFQEREVYDLFGVIYDGHPDMRRLLLPDDFSGHPLRKSYTETGGERP